MDVKTGPTHRQRQAAATRRQIAAAARQLFAERGYVATTIAAISERADIPAAVRAELGAQYVFTDHMLNPKLEVLLREHKNVEEAYRDQWYSVFY